MSASLEGLRQRSQGFKRSNYLFRDGVMIPDAGRHAMVLYLPWGC